MGPPIDVLLRFLLQASTDIQPPCANCDNKSRVPMYYCNTCGQALCNGCREETHRAKMFSAHDIIPVSKYTKETPKRCSVHGEQYIMFSTVQKSMLCINCYRDTAMESRLHCVDLETAYSQGCRKLDRAVMSLRDLQVAVRDGITMLKNVLEELRRNSDSEKSAVNAVCQTILDALTKTQENLLRDVDCQMDGKDKVIRGQLCQLRSVLPTIKLHLTMCATISNAASKYDFLDLAYPLIDRLTAITHMGYPIRPGQSSQIKSIYKAEIARTLEPWIAASQQLQNMSGSQGGAASGSVANASFNMSSVASSSSQLPKDYAHPSVNLTSVDPSFTEPTYSQYYPMSRSTVTPVMGHKTPTSGLVGGGYAAPAGIGAGPSGGRKTPTPGQTKSKGDGPDEHFTAHCRSFTAHFNDLSQRLSRLKEQVQDLHRDVTLQRGTSYSARAEAALREGLFLEDQLARRLTEMERMKKLFESNWNEHLRQVRIENEVFQSQLNDLMSLKAEAKQLSSILQQLQSFLKSVGAHQTQQPSGGDRGGGGTSGSGGPAGGGGSAGGSSGPPTSSAPPPPLPSTSQLQSGSSSSRQQQQQQQQSHHDNKSYHLSPTSESHSRTESSSQVTPSLGEMAYSKGGSVGGSVSKGKKEMGHGSGLKSDLTRHSGRFTVTKASLSSGSSASAVGNGAGSTAQSQSIPPGSFVPLSVASAKHQLHQQQQQQQQHQQHQHQHQHQQGQSGGHGQPEMEYIQVDTSYLQHSVAGSGSQSHTSRVPTPGTSMLTEPSMKRGMLSQLIDKVRSKDDRKKSSASGVSSSSSGGTIPHPPPPPVPSAASLAARRALTMYDAQCQYGTLTADNSAVTALAVASSNPAFRRSGSAHRSRGESRPIYTRAKSFVKSKSDDERPPTKLSKQSRARSAGTLETESLLRSLSSSSKEASRILSLYQSLSKGILLENQQQQQMHQQQQQQHQIYQQQQQQHHHHQQHHQQQQQTQSQQQSQQQQQQQQPSHYHQYSDRKVSEPETRFSGAESLMSTLTKGSGNSSTNPSYSHTHSHTHPAHPVHTTNGGGRGHSRGAGAGSSHTGNPAFSQQSRSASESAKYHRRSGSGGDCRPEDCLSLSEDDYQQIPVPRTHLIGRSQSAPPRKPSGSATPGGNSASTTQVQVYVHEEPRSTRSSPSATLSKSLEESYLYGYLAQHGGLTSSSSGHSGYASTGDRHGHPHPHGPHSHSHSGHSSAFATLKKPTSCESLISLSTEQNSNSHSRKSSIDFDRRSVVTVRRAGSKSALITRQHSWEAGAAASAVQLVGPPVKREQSLSTPHLSPDDPFGSTSGSSSRHSGLGGGTFPRSSSNPYDEHDLAVGSTLHKADSFEGHEEAVRSIVAAVQETRTLQRKLQSN